MLILNSYISAFTRQIAKWLLMELGLASNDSATPYSAKTFEADAVDAPAAAPAPVKSEVECQQGERLTNLP
jgi:hypothetical protein